MNEVKEALEAVVEAQITNADDGFDELINEWAPAEEVITVTLSGKTYTFRAIADRAAYNSIKKRGQVWSKSKAVPPGIPEAAQWLDTDPDTKTYAFILAETSIEPKLNPYRLLKIAKLAFLAFDELKAGFLLGMSTSRADLERQEIEKRKNESSETPAGETD